MNSVLANYQQVFSQHDLKNFLKYLEKPIKILEKILCDDKVRYIVVFANFNSFESFLGHIS